MLAWDEADQLRYGSASAFAVVLFLYVAVVAIVFVKVLGADVIGAERCAQARTATRPEGRGQPMTIPTSANAVVGTGAGMHRRRRRKSAANLASLVYVGRCR